MKFIYAFFIGIVGTQAYALTAPWYRLANKFQASIGADPCYKFKEMQNPQVASDQITMVIQACSEAKGIALAEILKEEYPSDHVRAVILDDKGIEVPFPKKPAQAQAIELLNSTLKENRFFRKAYSYGMSNHVVVEFAPEIVRVFIDNISIPDSSQCYVPSDLFGEFLRDSLGNVSLSFYTGQ